MSTKDDYYTIDDCYKVRNAAQAYLNDVLEDQVQNILRKDREESISHRISDFMYDHPSTFVVFIFSLCFSYCVIIATLGCFIGYKIDMAKLNEQARICTETGYGCVRNTTNTDIQYHDTPIIEVNKESK